MSARNQQLGKTGEDIAARNLEKRGFRIVARNVHMRHGEIDIIAVRDGVLHIIEVKTRRNDAFGAASQALTRSKFIKMKKSAAAWQHEQTQRHGVIQYNFAAVTMEPTPRL